LVPSTTRACMTTCSPRWCSPDSSPGTRRASPRPCRTRRGTTSVSTTAGRRRPGTTTRRACGPFMGVGYRRPLTQWSRGQYAGAASHQHAVVARRKAPAWYSATLAGMGGTRAYRWAVTRRRTPSGLVLSGAAPRAAPPVLRQPGVHAHADRRMGRTREPGLLRESLPRPSYCGGAKNSSAMLSGSRNASPDP